MNSPQLSDLLAVATDAARAAGQHTLKYFGNRLEISYKSDASPVTRADVGRSMFESNSFVQLLTMAALVLG